MVIENTPLTKWDFIYNWVKLTAITTVGLTLFFTGLVYFLGIQHPPEGNMAYTVTFFALLSSAMSGMVWALAEAQRYDAYHRNAWVVSANEDKYYVERMQFNRAKHILMNNLHHTYPFIENVFTGERIYRWDPEFVVPHKEKANEG